MDFFSKLFDTSDFPARWNCGRWTDGHGWLHILSDLGVWSAYFAIPLVLGYFVIRRKDLPFRRVFFLFGAFILLCGMTHLMEAIIFWWPGYRLAGLLKLITAIVSWITVFSLVPIVPNVLAMRSPEELEREIKARNEAEGELQRINAELEKRVEERTTKLTEALASLSAERELLRTTLASIGDGVIVTDRENRVTFLNPVAERLTGWLTADASNSTLENVFNIINEQTRQPVDSPAVRAITEGVIVGLANHTLLISKDGTQRPIDDSAAPIRNKEGHVVGCVLVFRDISERKRAEQRLVESEARYRAIGESIDYGVWVCDPSGRNTYASESFLRMVGITQQECSDFGWGDVLHPEDAEATILAWKECVRSQGRWDRVHRFKGVDGRWHHVLARGVPLQDATGQILGWAGLNLDISRIMEAEQKIVRIAAESERQRRLYETVLTNTPDFVYVFSLDHKVVYANDALIKMWGRDYDGAIGKTFVEIGYEPWHAEMHDREIDQVRATRQPIRGEVPFNGTNGRRMYDYIFVPVIGADGEVEAVAGTTRDVTERKEAEERQAFLIRLADTLRPVSDPVDVQAEASRVLGEHLRTNRVIYFEIRGDHYVIERDYTAGVRPLAGRYPVASFGPTLLAALLEGRTIIEPDATTEPDRPAGERAAFEAIQVRGHVDVPLVKGGRFVAGMTVHVSERRDWTRQEVALIEDTAERIWSAVEQVRAEAALRQSEERRRLALDAAELGSWQIDLVTNALTTDERFRIIFAGTTEAMNYEQAFAAIHPGDRERIRGAVAAAIRADDPAPYAEEYRVIHPDGAVRWVFAKGRANPDREGSGRLVSFDGTVADITARKLIEQERELLVGQLRDADRRKDEFLATLAHELRNPLAPIRNGLQVIRLTGADGTIEQARSMMERQLTQLVRLVDDLLDVSRVTRGKLELRKEHVELKSVIDAAVETSRPAIEEAGHQFSLVMPDEPIWVDGDVTRLAQVVSNLLNNSAKYMHPGGQIRVTVRREGAMAVVSVADDGIGIPPAMLDKVFEMFTQLDRAWEKTTGGLGIGLSLVKGVVDMHGGTIKARSEGEGRGSEFVVRLPMVLSGIQKVEAPIAEAPVGSSGRRRVLIADDNADSAEWLGVMLKMLGYDVSTASDGLEAVEVAAAKRPDVILLDIGMPKLNGHETCRRIREQPWAKSAIFIALTGWGQDEDKRRSKEAGFDHHMVKPVDPAVLEKLLAELWLPKK